MRYLSVMEKDSDISFSILGMENLIQDKERYALLYTQRYGISEDGGY